MNPAKWAYQQMVVGARGNSMEEQSRHTKGAMHLDLTARSSGQQDRL